MDKAIKSIEDGIANYKKEQEAQMAVAGACPCCVNLAQRLFCAPKNAPMKRRTKPGDVGLFSHEVCTFRDQFS